MINFSIHKLLILFGSNPAWHSFKHFWVYIPSLTEKSQLISLFIISQTQILLI